MSRTVAKSRSPSVRSCRSVSVRGASTRLSQPVAQDMAALRDSIETFTIQQVSSVAGDMAKLRSELDHVISGITSKISEDRSILGNLQHQADVVQSHLGDTATNLGLLRDHVLRIEQEVVRVRDTGISAVSTVHSELLALQRQPPVDLEHTPIDDQLRGDHNQLRTDFDTATTSIRTDMVALSTYVAADGRRSHRSSSRRFRPTFFRTHGQNLSDRTTAPASASSPIRVTCSAAPDWPAGITDFGYYSLAGVCPHARTTCTG